ERGIDCKIVEHGSSATGDKLGMQGGRIFFYDDSENWWSRSGGINDTPIGDPCGPDSEVFYDFGDENHDPSYGLAHPASDSGQFMEIGNQVFMQYRRLEDGSFEPLQKKNVDFGGGLERIAAAAINNPDVFQISLLRPIIDKLEELSGKKYASHTQSMRVIADHLRAATFLAVDGCKPSNKQQGYVMRRLLRRAIRFAFDLGVEQNFMEEVVPVIADLYTEDYPEVESQREAVIATLVKEEKAFRQTLRKGLKEFNKLFSDPTIDAGVALFTLYDTYGFPVELSSEEAFKQGIELPDDWHQRFEACMQVQRERSQTAAKGTFKGGLEGDSLQHKKYHTATHLLQSALREIFGEELRQHGSNITTERLRFDFNLDHKMSADDKARAEELVNGWIKAELPVSYQLYPTKEALDMGAIGPFGERYDEQVKVYQMGEGDGLASLEICGGPHVDNTGQLGEGGAVFKIKKEESSSAGIRRIKAVLLQD
ncbi:MAG: alanine--tRNA ligase-related protein, partial [bacterium]|nr:alanine--tRNA ligase-related protein [bacterium]